MPLTQVFISISSPRNARARHPTRWTGRAPEVSGGEILHRGRIKSLTSKARHLLIRCQAVEPVIGRLKDDRGLLRNWLKGSDGDVLHLVWCAAGYKLRWLMQAMTRLGLKSRHMSWLLVGILRRRLRSEGTPDRETAGYR